MPIRAVAIAFLTTAEALRRASSYEAFRRELGVERPDDTTSRHVRMELFDQRRQEVERHNARPDATWVAAVNKFTDFTEEEFRGMLGHRRLARSGAAVSIPLFAELEPRAPLAQAVDWSAKLTASVHPKDQGGCGSCWAVATAGALETHVEIVANGTAAEVSYEQLVDCVENPQECGGDGGCGGATSELAMEYVKTHGIVAKAAYKGYQSGGDGKCNVAAKPLVTTAGFVRLPENKMQPLLEALATQGPVVVSADASTWGAYRSGVFDDCTKNAIINHAIVAMGYGSDSTLKKDFFLIRNSWGKDWGEAGYIRVLRHKEDSFCGTDPLPLDGVGCKGGPESLPVCGMCGILSDSAYPTGVQLAQ